MRRREFIINLGIRTTVDEEKTFSTFCSELKLDGDSKISPEKARSIFRTLFNKSIPS